MSGLKLRSPSEALEKAVIDRLCDLPYTVFDREPRERVSRYVVIGELFEEEWRTKDRGGAEVSLTLEFFSASRSSKRELLKMMADVGDLLTATLLDLSGSNFFANEARKEMAQALQDESGGWRGQARYTFLVDDVTP